jgi:hypothetical protein
LQYGLGVGVAVAVAVGAATLATVLEGAIVLAMLVVLRAMTADWSESWLAASRRSKGVRRAIVTLL